MCVEIENIINKYMRRQQGHVDLLHFTVQMRMAFDVIDDSIWLLFFASYSFVSNIYLHLLKLNWIQAFGQVWLMHSAALSLMVFRISTLRTRCLESIWSTSNAICHFDFIWFFGACKRHRPNRTIKLIIYHFYQKINPFIMQTITKAEIQFNFV